MIWWYGDVIWGWFEKVDHYKISRISRNVLLSIPYGIYCRVCSDCHFLCTSNIAKALELVEMVVEQFRWAISFFLVCIVGSDSYCFKISNMANNGFKAYHCKIGQKVLVMPSVLFFLADSPMHAEITNTPVPGCFLNPCQHCVLHSASLKERKKIPYISRFTQKNLHGVKVFVIYSRSIAFQRNQIMDSLFL
jgi:hypothetical protein